jgi:hypothetical protein
VQPYCERDDQHSTHDEVRNLRPAISANGQQADGHARRVVAGTLSPEEEGHAEKQGPRDCTTPQQDPGHFARATTGAYDGARPLSLDRRTVETTAIIQRQPPTAIS